MRKIVSLLVLAMAFLVLANVSARAQEHKFSIGLMQSQGGEAAKYAPLVDYLKAKGVEVSLKGYSNYTDAAMKFANGEVDAMFSGSGVAGAMIIKDLAVPILRPVTKEGWSTYWAVIVAPKGSPKFTGDPKYFDGKKIICSALASSGEFYARSILGKDRELMEAASHGAALSALEKGMADIAIVKNRVWDGGLKEGKYPSLEKVGQDEGENPDGTLIIAKQANSGTVAKIRQALMDVNDDTSDGARAIKKEMNIMGFVPTSLDDFKHTLKLIEKAGVTKDFDFGNH